MDRLEAMSILVAATEAGSLSAAGRRLGMPLATVSRKVSDLENHLRTRLLTRSTRQLTLTDAGHAYVAACRRILEEVSEAERAASGEYSAPKGDLIVTAPIVFGRMHVLPVVAQFLKAYPDIDIRLVLADRIVHLLDDHIDLAVRIGQLPDSSLVATSIGYVRNVVCASPAYLREHGTPKEPTDLARHDCINFEGSHSTKNWTFGTGKSRADVKIRARLSVNTAEAAVDAALAGVGITRVLSYQMAAAAKANGLKILLRTFEPPPLPINLVYAEQGLLPLKLRAFLDFAAPPLRNSLPS
jgi:DNA-binding transcriptional LysR family regulator